MKSIIFFVLASFFVFPFTNCKTNIDLGKEIQGIWKIDSITEYRKGLENVYKQTNRYLEFNKYGDVVLYEDSVLISHPYKLKKDTLYFGAPNEVPFIVPILKASKANLTLKFIHDSSININHLTKTPYKKLQDIDNSPNPDVTINTGWDGNIYRNSEYKFFIEFPKNWEYDNGTAELTLARALNKEKAIAISINVQENILQAKGVNIFEWMSEKDVMNTIIQTTSISNTKAENIIIDKGSLNNFPAYIFEFESTQSAGTKSFKYISKQVQCLYESKLYTLTINLPLEEWTEENKYLFRQVVESFKFFPYN